MSDLPRLLSRLLKRKKLADNEFAARVGLTRSAISKILSGRNTPRAKRAPQWCAALGLNAKDCQKLTEAMQFAAAGALVKARVKRLEREVSRLRRGRK